TADVTFASGSKFLVDTSTTTSDVLNITGGVDLGGATLMVNLLATPAENQVYTIISNDGTDPTVGTFANLPNGATFTVDGQPFRIDYDVGVGGNDVTLTVPEPASVALLALAGVGLLRRRRRQNIACR